MAYKIQAVKLANHPDVRSKDVAESLGIHPVMLYRWQMEHRRRVNGVRVKFWH
ncbi:transposase [Microbulbifer donghaiensis]|uniref:transposase n=1 Tax=Microbulbifer donghaiensis TaxID=494016 RepID=UPI0011611315